MKRYRMLNKLLFLVSLIALFGCSSSSDSGGGGMQTVYVPAEVEPKISVYSKYIPLNIKEANSYNLNATVTPSEKSSEPLHYSGNNEDIASVSAEGVITAHQAGVAEIGISLVNYPQVAEKVIVHAYEGADDEENAVPATAIAVDETYVKITKGGKVAVFPTVRPRNATNKEVGYISTNENVAVLEDGFIIGKNEGYAEIFVYAKSNPQINALISVDVTPEISDNSGSIDFTPPEGLAPIDLAGDPMSLIAQYKIVNYRINCGGIETAGDESKLAVNVNLDELGAGFIKILMYINLNGKEVRLIQKKNLGDYGSIPDIFTSLGAKITGDYTMQFTLEPELYTELARKGVVNKGDTLVVNIAKMVALTPAGGLGDIAFDESTVPVEGTIQDEFSDVKNGGACVDISFTPPAGLAPIDLAGDPMSLIAQYKIINYSINGGEVSAADDVSKLAVNVNLDELGAGFIKILMYINLDGKEARLIQKKNMGDYDSIPDIFTSLGAKITGDYTMEFTLEPSLYTELARKGVVNKGDTLVVNIGKMVALTPAGGLGDIAFDESSVPVEGTIQDEFSDGTKPEEKPEEKPGDDNAGDDKPSDSEPAEVQVEKIELDITEFQAISKGEVVQITATVLPENAVDKTITWTSSDTNVATVDKNGLVTVHKNGSAVITAKSVNGKKAAMKITPAGHIDDFNLTNDYIELTMEVDKEAGILYRVYPEILNGENLSASFVSGDESIVSVDSNGTITAVAEGETYVSVTIDGILKECFVKVNPKPANATPVSEVVLSSYEGKYDVTNGAKNFTIEAAVLPEDAFNKRLKYSSSNVSVATVNAFGEVTVRGVGSADIIVTAAGNEEITAVYKVIAESYYSEIVFEQFDYGIEVGKTANVAKISGIAQRDKISYALVGNPSNKNLTWDISDKNIAEIDGNGNVFGKSAGTTTLTVTAENGTKGEVIIHVYNPIVVGDASSLQGTYEIVDFSQYNGTLNVGTNNYGGVERMIGEMTIKVTGNTVKITSKIQMDSSKMNSFNGVMGIGKDEARSGQFQYTEYAEAGYSSGGFGTKGKTSAEVSHDKDMLKLYQEWEEMGIATVQVNTWIKKKSNDIKDLKQNTFHFGYKDKDKTQKSNAFANKGSYYPNVNIPEKEPYYTYGKITK